MTPLPGRLLTFDILALEAFTGLGSFMAGSIGTLAWEAFITRASGYRPCGTKILD